MLDLVIGGKRNAIAADELIAQLKKANYTGTLYVGYPILASLEETILVDALLTTLEQGVVVFDFWGAEGGRQGLSELQQRQDAIYNAVRHKLLSSRLLLRGRQLAVPINVVTLSPDPETSILSDDLVVICVDRLLDYLGTLEPIDEGVLRNLNAAVQVVTTLRPQQKRMTVKSPTSRGGIMKEIEAQIANLDQWQKRAAIETPDGPQRIRGLAGSGKTIVLALKAAYLHVMHPEWRIAVTFQTRSLYQQFEDLIRRFTFEHVQDEPDWNALRILHAWGSPGGPGIYSEIAQAHGLPTRDFAYAKTSYGYSEAFDGVCREVLDRMDDDVEPQYDAVLIDEAQDFPHSFFQMVYLATHPPKRIIWAYDELQNLGSYSMAPPSELFGNDADGKPRVSMLPNGVGEAQGELVLPICYRNTPWALCAAHALGFGIYREGGLVQFFDDPELWDAVGYEVTDGMLSPGKPVDMRRRRDSYPRYFDSMLDPSDALQCHVFRNEAEQAEWVAGSIRTNVTEDELQLRDILVILCDPLTARTKSALLIEALGKHGIPAHLAGVTLSRDVLFSDQSIAITGIYRAKGNEAPMVYVLNSQYGYSGLELIRRRNTLFTAVTRSRGWVRLCGWGPAMDGIKQEVDRVVGNGYALRFRVPTPPELAMLRRIHRDRTPQERSKAQALAKALSDFAASVEQGNLPIESLPPELRARLEALFGGGD